MSDTIQKPSLGRIVLYKLREGASAGQERPAMIVRVWTDDCVQLKVFLDEVNDHGSETFASSATRAGAWAGDPEGTWRWPPRT
jgi:hypothetical protein